MFQIIITDIPMCSAPFMLLAQLPQSNNLKTYRNFSIPHTGKKSISIPPIRSINLWCFDIYCSAAKYTKKKNPCIEYQNDFQNQVKCYSLAEPG